MSTMSLPFESIRLEGPQGLVQLLDEIMVDPRKPRGIRHPYRSTLLLALSAVLSGKRSYVAIGRWVANLTQKDLRRLSARISDPITGHRVAPEESTIRRILSKTPPDKLDLVLTRYVEAHSEGDAIAFDGKVIRASGISFMSALIHGTGAVVAQKRLDGPKRHEIPAAPDLLLKIDLAGKVVTADALHTQAALARTIKERGADTVFTVKDNQKTLKSDIESLDHEAFFPSR